MFGSSVWGLGLLRNRPILQLIDRSASAFVMLFRFLKTLLGVKPSKGAIPKPPSPQDALVKQFRRPVAAQVSVSSQKPSRTATSKTTVKLSPAQEEAVRAASGPDPAVFLTG